MTTETSHTDRRAAVSLVEELASMSEERAERWMRKNGYTSVAAFALNKKVRAFRKLHPRRETAR